MNFIKLLSFFLLLILSIPTHAERVLIHLSEPIAATELTQLNKQARIVHDLHPLPWLVLEIPNTRRILRTTKAGISKTWDYQPDILGTLAADTTPNDPRYKEQWHLTEIGAPSLWEQTQGEGVIVALLDSGVDPQHPDLSDNILMESGYDFGDEDNDPIDQNGHGTAMAGLIVAKCHNQIGGCGVAPLAKIIPYKINKKSSNQFLASNLAAAILAAAESPAKILSLSLVLKEESQVVQEALLYAKSQNKIIVAAAGNNRSSTVAYPANIPWIIGVGAFDKKGKRFPKSNYGNGLSLNAPGYDLLTTGRGDGYVSWFDGTSPAAALVSGVLALMTAQNPNATAPELAVTLLAACEDVDTPGFDKQSGFGHLKIPYSQTQLTTKPTLKFLTQQAQVLYPEETLHLDLSLENVASKTADLYLRINLPIDNQGERIHLYKIWNRSDSLEATPYNVQLASPYLLTSDIILPLYGTPNALLGTGKVEPSLHEGIYEFLALLTFTNNQTIQTRKMIWITKTEPK
jgi:subtilisin family serine protease